MREQIRRRPRHRAIGPVATLTRLAVGLLLLYLALGIQGLGWHEWVLGLVVLPLALLLWQGLRTRRSPARLEASGPAAEFLNVALALPLFILPWTRGAALLFYGASMLVAAVRGYGGCEILALSNWLLRRDDQLGCLLFSPIDRLEQRRLHGREA